MTDVPPTVIDPVLGPLWRREGDLAGAIAVPPAIRRPRHDGSTDCEISLRLGPQVPGPDLDADVSRAAAAICVVLTNLDSIKHFGLEHAPRQWREHYTAAEPVPLFERLFLDFLEVGLTFQVSAWFDFGDLDQLVVHVDSAGRGICVEIHP